MQFQNYIHRRVAECAEELVFSFAAERAANEKPQPLRGKLALQALLFNIRRFIQYYLAEGLLFFTFWLPAPRLGGVSRK